MCQNMKKALMYANIYTIKAQNSDRLFILVVRLGPSKSCLEEYNIIELKTLTENSIYMLNACTFYIERMWRNKKNV